MPFTFVAHQAPVIPLKMRWPDRWDGLALCVGSIMPDLWYVTSGWLFGPGGMPLWTDGHRLDLVVQNCLLPGLLLTFLIRRFVMPVVPAVMPKAGVLRLPDYRLLALSHHRWWVTTSSVLVGAVSHIAIDGVTHHNGPFGWPQTLGHVVGGIWGLWLLREISRRKLQWAWHGYRTRPPDPVVHRGGRAVVWGGLALTSLLAAAYATSRLWLFGELAPRKQWVPATMAFTWVVLLGTIVTGMVGRRFVDPVPPPSPASVDPLVQVRPLGADGGVEPVAGHDDGVGRQR